MTEKPKLVTSAQTIDNYFYLEFGVLNLVYWSLLLSGIYL